MTTSIKGGIPVGGNLAFRDLVYRPGVDGSAEMMPMPYYGGGMGIEQLAADPSFQIGPRNKFKGMSQEELNKLKEWDQRPGDLQKYYNDVNSPGPQLFPLAQAIPGGMPPMGNAGALGGAMNMNSALMEQMQMQEGPPIRFGVDIENDKVKNLRGSVDAQLDKNQSINFGGNYNVQDQSGQLGLGYRTKTFGFDANITRTPRFNGAPAYGVQGSMMGRF